MALAEELRLVAQGVRAAIGTPDTNFRQPAAIRWPMVIEAVRAHRCQVLANLAPWAPADIRAELARIARQNVHDCLAQVAATARLCRLLEGAGIRVIVIKGVVLSQQLYGDPARRGAGDVDLLVEPQRFWEADELMRRAGYAPYGPHPKGERARGALSARVRDLQFVDPAGAFIEMHQRLTSNADRLPMDFDALWAARQQVALAGMTFSVLPRLVLPLYLCVHGTHHCWARLCWLADLAVLLRDPADRRDALDEAARLGLEPALRLALALSHRLLGCPTEPPDPADRAQAELYLRRFFSGPDAVKPPAPGTWRWVLREVWRRRYLYALRPGWGHAWREMRADLADPVDVLIYPLPGWAGFLYPLLRPILRPLNWLRRKFGRR